MNKAFFLDRDGTINVDTGYVGDPDDLELLPGVGEAIKRMNDLGFLVIVISNQSGVARGYFSIEDVKRVNNRLNTLLSEYGAHIDDFYFCPHHPDGCVKEYSMDCNCRKPKLGLFQRAIIEHELIPNECYACGDNLRDIENLEALGLKRDRLKLVDYRNNQGLAEVFKILSR